MTTQEVDLLLRAEKEANRLVEQLQKLKAEAESYQNARAVLAEAGSGLGGLAARLGELAKQVGGLAEALRASSTPKLVRRVNDLAEETRKLRETTEQQHRSIAAACQEEVGRVRESLEAKLAALAGELRGHVNTVSAETGKLGNRLEDQLRLLADAFEQEVGRLGKSLEPQLTAVRRTARNGLLLLVAANILLVVLAVGLL